MLDNKNNLFLIDIDSLSYDIRYDCDRTNQYSPGNILI